MEELKWEDAKQEIKKGLVFLEFFTDWCSDCKMIEPVMIETELACKEKKLPVKFIKVNGEEANLFREEDTNFKVKKVPSFYVIKDGKKNHLGYKYSPKEFFVKAIEEAYKS